MDRVLKDVEITRLVGVGDRFRARIEIDKEFVFELWEKWLKGEKIKAVVEFVILDRAKVDALDKSSTDEIPARLSVG